MPYIEKLTDLCREYGCEIKIDEPIKNHTTFKIGGNCRGLVMVNSAESLADMLKFLKSENIKYFILGRGSNVLASDEGYEGVILKISRDYSKISLIDEKRILCTAGASLKDVCLFALEHALSGLEFAYGIPGTCGGALFMNAGAYGGEIKDVVEYADFIDEKGNNCRILTDKMELGYRKSIFSGHRDFVITDMVFKFNKGDKEKIKARMDEYMEKRRTKQPLEYPSAGSTFKRPEDSYASLLIEQCGLKGMACGGAQVSEKHSGFVINTGKATFNDVMTLCSEIKKIVKEKTGFILELEPIVLK